MIFCAPFLPRPGALANAAASPSATARARRSGGSVDSSDSATLGPMPLTFCSCRNMRLDACVRNPYSVTASWDTLSEVNTRVSCPACRADRSAAGMRTS